MSFDFPNSPTEGTLFAPSGGPIYVYKGGVWKMQGSGQVVTAEAKNRIINPSGVISQEVTRGAGVSGNGSYFADQWSMHLATTGGPVTSTNDTAIVDPDVTCALRINSAAGPDAVVAVSDYVFIRQMIEGKRIADFKWGTALAKPVVLVFTALSTVAGTFCVSVRDASGSVGYVRNCPIAANVTTKYLFAIPGCTTGTWPVDNTASMQVSFAIMAGTNLQGAEGVWSTGIIATSSITNWMAATNQNLYVTNVGLYLDPNATGVPPPWQMPDEAQELLTCQRYYRRYVNPTDFIYMYGYNVGTAGEQRGFTISPTMRIGPTGTALGGWTASNASGLVFTASGPSIFTLGTTVVATGAWTIQSTGAAGNGITLSARM